MEQSSFTEEQILLGLKHLTAEQPVAEISRQIGNSGATIYVWKTLYGNLRLLQICELRQLRDENGRLKRLEADLMPDRYIPQAVVKKGSDHVQASSYASILSPQRDRYRAEHWIVATGAARISNGARVPGTNQPDPPGDAHHGPVLARFRSS